MPWIPNALIFDIDGTLAETEELHRKAFNITFADYGLDWVWDQSLYGELLKVAGGQNRIRHYLQKYQPKRFEEFDQLIPEMHARKTRAYCQLLTPHEIELRPGIETLINSAIDKGIKLGISTSTSRINVNRLFEASLGLALLDRFSAICCGDDVAKVKPAPDVYLLALKQLKLTPENCLAIEDSELGLKAAIAAGIPTLITVSTYCRHDDFTGAKMVMADLVKGKFSL